MRRCLRHKMYINDELLASFSFSILSLATSMLLFFVREGALIMLASLV